MATLFSDDFNRANNTDLGASWTEVKGNHQIVSNALQLAAYNSANNFSDCRADTDAHAAVADCKVTATRVSGTSFDALVYARGSGTDSTYTGYVLNVYGSNNIEVYRFNSGTSALIGARNATHSNGDSYGLQVSGTGATITFKVIRNGSQVGADLTDTSGSRITAAGQTGLGNWSTSTSTWDDFLVEDLGGTQSYSYSASGGLSIAGVAAALRSRAVSVAGGISLGGATASARVGSRTASGGISLVGAASFARGQTVAPSGGLSLSGAATKACARVAASAGGLQMSGAATVSTSGTQTYAYTATGGLVLAGNVTQARKASRTSSGGIAISGAAAASSHESRRTVTASGGISLGGAASISTLVPGQSQRARINRRGAIMVFG